MKENFQLPLDHCENFIVTYKLTETGIYLQQLTEDNYCQHDMQGISCPVIECFMQTLSCLHFFILG